MGEYPRLPEPGGFRKGYPSRAALEKDLHALRHKASATVMTGKIQISISKVKFEKGLVALAVWV